MTLQALPRRMLAALILAPYFVYELMKSSLIVGRDALIPHPALKPGIVNLPISCESDAEILLLSCLITLTPGTMTLDVAPDRSFLVIHTLYAGDEAELVAGMEAGMVYHVREVFR